jgi:uncharacterized membrane protein
MKKKYTSAISGIEISDSDVISCGDIRFAILKLIKVEHPNVGVGDFISKKELTLFREKYIANFLHTEITELSDLHKDVIQSISQDDSSFVKKIDEEEEKDDIRTFGQIIADKVASFGGSWTFIISFLIFILIWISSNAFILINKGFDPYPFILLNLILSCLAALQAPVIMMSQNRQEEKDRERAKKDYMINLKSEVEIRLLDEKLDHLIIKQQQELIEIQKVQIEMMNDILDKIEKK